jgi:hypothetical protein
MSALMLAAMIAAALGIGGPFDFAKLEKWQTLMAAFIAPSIALVAAIVAYRGAMAKVEYDREEAARRRNNEKLGLFLRLRASLMHTFADADAARHLIRDETPNDVRLAQSVEIRAQRIAVHNPAELIEAWNSIHLMPAMTIAPIEGLKRLLPLIEGELEKFADHTWTIRFPHGNLGRAFPRAVDDYLRLHATRCEVVQEQCKIITDVLGHEIPILQQRFE